METDTAELLEQQILNGRVAFPCGCVLECRAHYPGKGWAYTGNAVHMCIEHPYPDRVAYVNRRPVDVAGLMQQSFPTPLQARLFLAIGPLERKWLKPDATQVTINELEEAMEENLDRLDDEARESVERAFRTMRHVYHGISQDHIVRPPPQFGRISRCDPHIVSQERVHAIGRHGSVAAIPGRRASMTHDEMLETEKTSYRPGDWIDLPKLQRMYNEQKFLNFGLIDMERIQEDHLHNWPQLRQIGKGFKPNEIVDVTDEVRKRLPGLAEKISRDTLMMGLEGGLSRDALRAYYDTLSLTPSPPDQQEEKKEKE